MTNVDSGQPMSMGKFAKKEVVYDLMRGGPGTPWENRGEFGAVGAVVRTGVRALFKPNLLFDHIRNTTITSEAQKFLWVCAGCWGLSVAILKGIEYFLIDTEKFDVDPVFYLITTLIQTAVSVVFAFCLMRLLVGLYHKLVVNEIKQPVPTSLTFNVVAYAMGPSIFAPIPFIGPLLALVGSFVALVAAGRKRLYVKWGASIIDALIPFAVAVVLTTALYFVGALVISMSLAPVTERVIYVAPPPM